jgi:hypothetical protein
VNVPLGPEPPAGAKDTPAGVRGVSAFIAVDGGGIGVEGVVGIEGVVGVEGEGVVAVVIAMASVLKDPLRTSPPQCRR